MLESDWSSLNYLGPPKYEDGNSTINDADDDSVSLRGDRNLDQLPTASQVKVETEDEYLVLTALACLFRVGLCLFLGRKC